MNNLKTVLTQLQSDKVRERTEGLAALRTTFSRKSVIDNLDKDGKGRAWLVVFQALYTAVGAERTEVLNKGALDAKNKEKPKPQGAQAMNRLGECARAVRWLAERSVHTMNKKVIMSLLNHILPTLNYRGIKLLEPVASDYVKTIRALISYPPHLEHLDDATWIRLVQLGFNVVLDDPLAMTLQQDLAASGKNDNSPDTHVSGLDSSQDEDEDAARSKKRPHRSPSGRRTPAPRRTTRRISKGASSEQVEFMAILSILLRSNKAPFLSKDHPYLPEAILSRLRRFIDMYPSDYSLYHDFLLAISGTLGHLSLNKTDAVREFALHTWDGLIEVMGTKNKTMKESLLAVLKTLFPYLTMNSRDGSDSGVLWSEGVGRLWQVLEAEVGNRRGIEPLALDALRFQLVLPSQEGIPDEASGAFIAKTFRHGFRFTSSQALTWAVLELQADCLKKLLILSESMRGSSMIESKSSNKRARLQNPLATLLNSVQYETQSIVRSYRLQLLLFFIDRHWSILHADHQRAVMDLLNQNISVDDAIAQSWIFLCFAAVAFASGDSSQEKTRPTSFVASISYDRTAWDSIWTHLVRRANIALVSRAACHAGHTILRAARHLVSPQCVLSEIETLAKDLDVQGPTFPHDSVCAFLDICLSIASQDIRLYRMQLEEKALSWLIEVWRVDANSAKALSSMSTHVADDILALLQTICSAGKRAHIICRILLPDCFITRSVIEEQKHAVIREYMLDAYLPPYLTTAAGHTDNAIQKSSGSADDSSHGHDDSDLSEPRARERRISAFLLKLLEDVSVQWGTPQDVKLTAERARRDLDLAVVALTFEYCLVMNGIRSNRRVVQAACRVITQVRPLLTDSKLTDPERLSLILGVEPLVMADPKVQVDEVWETMLPPSESTGIRRQVMRKLLHSSECNTDRAIASRRRFLRLVWQSSDIQDVFVNVLEDLRDVARATLGCETPSTNSAEFLNRDDEDDFGEGPSRTQTPASRTLESGHIDDSSSVCLDIVRSCTLFLAMVPILQTSSGEPTRDKELSNIFLKSGDMQFIAFAGPYFYHVRLKTLSLSPSVLNDFLERFAALLPPYRFSRNESLQLLAVQFLDSTSHIWLNLTNEASSTEDLGEHIFSLFQWLRNALKDGKIRSWKTRDHLVQFFNRYVTQDPAQVFWRTHASGGEEDEADTSDILPAALLPTLGADVDSRVRFRAAVLNAGLFRLAYLNKWEPVPLYTSIIESLCYDLAIFEHMLTRLICLGNIMIVSSAIRRGPFWHLLETCLGTSIYNAHIKAILLGVSERMGMSDISQLFEAYASQVAYSIRQGEFDILRFPPHILGYPDRRACAEATFHAFSPPNLLGGGSSSNKLHGKKLFANHCKAIQKTVEQGLRDCFSDVMGHQLVFWVDDHIEDENAKVEELHQLLLEKVADMHESHNFDQYLYQRADSILAAIVRTCGDQDFSRDGSIIQALRAIDEDVAQAFRDLSKYRRIDEFPMHDPNLPNYSVTTILHSMKWFYSLVSEIRTEAVSYHLLHQLFADIQRSSLVNEQMRLLNGMLIWVAFHYSQFRDATLLRTIINGATILLCQSDLSRTAQSILEWAFECYRNIPERDPRFSNIVVRISCIAQDYSEDIRDKTVSQLGSDLLQWIEEQASLLSGIDSIRPQILKALPAWPRELSVALASIYSVSASNNLFSTLEDHRMSGSKFRLVRRLRDALPAMDNSRFARTDFWRLKECIPPPESIQDNDAEAFAELLILAKGRIESFAIDQAASETVRTRHQRYGRKRDADSGSFGTALTYRPIIMSLLSLLDSPSANRTNNAYHTLRLLVSVCSPTTLESRHWSSDVRGELRFFQSHSVTAHVSEPRAIQDLQTNQSLVDLAKDFTAWITTITRFLSDILAAIDPFFAQLCTILVLDAEFAEQMLPILIHTILESARRKEQGEDARNLISRYLLSVLSLKDVHTSSLRAVVDVILHLRHFSPDNSDALAHDRWLELDYTLLSRSALKFGAYTTALLFLELAVEHSFLDADAVDEQILYEIYSHIDEPDGFYGIKTRDLHQFLIKRFHHERQWDRAFKFHGANLEAGTLGHTDVEGIVQSFHSFGFHHLAIATPMAAADDVAGVSSSRFNYDLGWRTETWDLPDQAEGATDGASLYRALRAVHRERDERAVDLVLHDGLREEINRLRSLGDENLVEIREVARSLMSLSQICRWRTGGIQESIRRNAIHPGQWSLFYTLHPGFDFNDSESIMATRISLIRSAVQKEQREQIGTMVSTSLKDLTEIEKRCLVRLSAAARESHQLQVALNSIVRAQKLEQVPSLEVSEEFAQVLWLHSEQKLAVQLLNRLLDSSEHGYIQEEMISERKASLLARLGTWTSEACLQKPTDILSQYFDPAVGCLSQDSLPLSSAIVYQQCAMFAERQYNAILKSDDAIRWKVYIDRKTQEIKQRSYEMGKLSRGSSQWTALKRDQDRAEKLLELDEDRWRRHQSALDAFIQQAVDMHSRYLEVSDEFDDDGSIRLCSLWFANFDNATLQPRIRSALERIPSRKFVFLSHQLSARLSMAHNDRNGQDNLQVLLIRMCREHPFHSLYQVYCLRGEQTSSQSQSQSASRRHSSRHDSPFSQVDRATAAIDIFDRLRAEPNSTHRIERIESLCNASLQWAKYPIKKSGKYEKSQKGPFQVPEGLLIRQIQDLDVPVMTTATPIDPTMQYSCCVWINHFEATFETAGGVNLPKITNCIGSDGEKYKQLFKGEGGDDLRQDAVMEQVFELVNIVLQRDVETRKRDLNVRGYKVIPLAAQAGVIQYVKNTTPLQSWLFAAHIRYRPRDMTHKDIHGQLTEKRKQCGGQVEPLVALFLEIRKRFRPVMRHYFTERHKNPMSWFSKRLNYTRSVATTSIVGYVLGLGDRHTSNILLDNSTGQVVHIDLGIAFDQGKLLPVPERVPFRMTADIVDGMGMSGTQGVFQRCAEETLRVLRDGSGVIMTVLEVFKHDPLHSWTASELKVKRMQGESAPTFPDGTRMAIGIDMTSGSADEAADRALTSVAKKLDKSLSVEYTVNDLIAQATDPVNLATIFPGWGPHY